MSQEYTLDLVILVPGKDEEKTIEGLLTDRQESLGIREIKFKILVHPGRDPGCYHKAQEILRPFIKMARYALVIFDHEGSGQEDKNEEHLASELLKRLFQNGWLNRAEVVVIEPELEIWVWSDSSEVDQVLGWSSKSPGLRQWLQIRGLMTAESLKPSRPKETLKKALREVKIRRSSAIYGQLANRVNLDKCQDPSFNKLKNTFQHWFQT